MPPLTIRKLETHEEFRQCERIQRSVWGRLSVSREVLQVTQKYGGVVLGAFVGARMAGFLYAFLGRRRGQLIHWSHMMAVESRYRDGGMGFRMKLMHRQLAPGGNDLLNLFRRKTLAERPALGIKALLLALNVQALPVFRLRLAPRKRATTERCLHEAPQAMPGFLVATHGSSVTAVPVVLRIRHHAGADWVQINICGNREQGILAAFDQDALEPLLPERAATTFPGVVVLRELLLESLKPKFQRI